MTLTNLLAAARNGARAPDLVDSALETVRRHLGMEVAYLSEFVGDQSVFRAVSAPGLEALIKPGDSRPLSEVYCLHILAGRLPSLIPDTSKLPFAASLPITAQVPIGSHVSVPIHREDGSVYGMFCCLSPHPNPSLTPRDLEVVQLFANLSAEQVNLSLADRARTDRIVQATRQVMAPDGFAILYQPIFDVVTRRPQGFEALCRFAPSPYRSPDIWFGEAGEVGLAAELESHVANHALSALDRLPAPFFVSINAAPETIASGALVRVLEGRDLSRIVVEVTEQTVVSEYDVLVSQLAPWRRRGLRLAVDDAGAGYSGLQQILRLRPDKIKLDMSLTRDIHKDNARASLAAALATFARKTDAILIAEGVETEAELAALRELDVPQCQGYLLGRPATLEQSCTLVGTPWGGPAGGIGRRPVALLRPADPAAALS
jgi:EAL domain-containing protein (putative c-di-GMP-specific phosphodiesterase class I)